MPNAKRPRVVIADDVPKDLSGLHEALNLRSDIEVVGLCGTAQSMLLEVERLKPDLLITDLVFFDDDEIGPNTIRKLKRQYPLLKVVAVTAHTKKKAEAANSGADVVVEKNYSLEDLTKIINSLYPPQRQVGSVSSQSATKTTSQNPKLQLALVNTSLVLILFAVIAGVYFAATSALGIQGFLLTVPPILITWSIAVLVLGSSSGLVSKSATYKLISRWLDILRKWLKIDQ